MRKLVEGSGVLVPFSVHQLAAGSGRIGDALAILLPHVFSADELKEPSVKDLDQDKVASLVGMILDLVFSFSFSFFSFFLSFFFFFFFCFFVFQLIFLFSL